MVSEAGKYAAFVTDYSGLSLNSVFTDNYISTSSGKEAIFRLVETVNSAVKSRQYVYYDTALFLRHTVRFYLPRILDGGPL